MDGSLRSGENSILLFIAEAMLFWDGREARVLLLLSSADM